MSSRRWLALYLNVFVAVAQAFLKVPSLNALAPTGSEPPFVVAQGIVLLIFVALCIVGAQIFPSPRDGLMRRAV